MNTVKHLKGSNLQPLRKKRFTFWNKHHLACAVLASLLGSYLDLYFIGKKMYQFPFRPLPEIFSFNIAFTLVGLPILVVVFLYCMSQVNQWGKAGIILFVSLLMPIFEKLAEELGWFVHSEEWKHVYSFVGYLVFLSIITFYFLWLEKQK
ncbi:CBO0543 family protein [Neobacillus pocheonensis]|uniref:CBO0543 family protein n=1 Tax=Neobacillus pocheonensis TaxID=363869 RepID=UPI003D2D1C51